MRGFLDRRRSPVLDEIILRFMMAIIMTIKVEKSKTDQLRQGDEVIITQSGGSACPVSILRDYLSRLNIDPHSDELIFRQLVKTKSFYKMVNKDKPISYTTFRDHLSKSLRSVVPDPSVYGTHSFRSGGATKAANSGVGERLFHRHGGEERFGQGWLCQRQYHF